MEAYPLEFVTHEAPLLLLSGLGFPGKSSETPAYPLLENGTRITSDIPAVTTETAEILLDHFLRIDISGIWPETSGRSERVVKGVNPVFRIRAVGRNYTLPPRKANPPSPGTPDSSDSSLTRVLHSPISPLSPNSPLYPDGAVSHIWLRKHQSILPSSFVSFYELYTDSNENGIQNLKDNELIASVNLARKSFSPVSNGSGTSAITGNDENRGSGYRTKFVVVILSEKSILSLPQIDDRLAYIRRSTNLSTNITFFFVPAHSSPVELQQFTSNLLEILYPGAVEYYRDLSKHSRRKRNKGSIPPPTVPSSRALSSQAWNLRYEFKLGVFAEFRQEMDAAARNYETAYEKLLTEVFESTASWSDRWIEARLLADILTLRIIRCQLWGEQYTAAKRRWNYHIEQMKEILDRKARGTETYGFAAWISRWNRCLADLLQAANLPVFAIHTSSLRSPALVTQGATQEPPTIFAPPEKSISVSDRLAPYDHLHHAGFYYLKAAEYIAERKRRAGKIAADDSADTHDLYLCPPPQEESTTIDHDALQISMLLLAKREFELRLQRRMADSITYTLAQLKMSKASQMPELWVDALKDLRIVAGIYRKEGWWAVLEDILWRIVECGRKGGDGGSVVIAELELMNREVFKRRSGWRYDLGNCLQLVESVRVKPTIVVRGGDVVSFLVASYAFESSKIHVGESIVSQLVVSSKAHLKSAPITFSELKITYEGNLKTILLRHDESSPTPANGQTTTKIDLKGKAHEQHHSHDEPLPSPTSSQSFLVASTDLSLSAGSTKIFEISTILRESGEAKAVCATFVLVSDGFELDFMLMLDDNDTDNSAARALPHPPKKDTTPNGGNGVWWIEGVEGDLKRKPVRAREPGKLEILPKPPKMEVTAKSGVEGGVYVDEIVRVCFEVENGEDEEAVIGVGVKVLGWPGEEPPEIAWVSQDETSEPESITSLYPLGNLAPSEKASRSFVFPSPSVPSDCSIEISVNYHLLSDPDTPISKTIIAEMPVVNPFQAAFDFSPRVHPDKWPDYFSLDDKYFEDLGAEDKKERILGISQRWCLTAKILGLGEHKLVIESCELPVLGVAGGIRCSIVKSGNEKPQVLEPQQSIEIPFILDVQKHSLEDRRSSTVDVNLIFHWRRLDSPPNSHTNTTTLLVPRLPIPGSEPRVLAAASTLPSLPGVVTIDYSLENPTNYFLTFNVNMETNEAFAFSGPKQTSIQLLPVSRVPLSYRLYPYSRGEWIRPGLRVVDRYFNKTLRCSPGGEGMSTDKAGLMVWVPEEAEMKESKGEKKDDKSEI